MVADLTPPLAHARRVVVKVGSALLVHPKTGLRAAWLRGLAADLAMLAERDVEAVIVSSGAIALGRGALGLAEGALKLEEAQAAASVGQIALARAYAEALAEHGLRASQVLLTLADTQDRRRYLNGCATLGALLRLGATPVVNENDTVATDEIRYGDNDRLAARVALMAGADALVLLSDVDGLYTADPRRDPTALRLATVAAITPEIEAMASGAGSVSAKGGMITKLMAAKTATAGGCAMAITRGAPQDDPDRPIRALFAGAPATWFLASTSPQAARKNWIAGMKPLGALRIDAGAEAALAAGRSLLPAGLKAVSGRFERGDPVSILRDADGAAIGAALSAYASEEAARIAGLRSAEIEGVLGYPARAALAHRDDMALWAQNAAAEDER